MRFYDYYIDSCWRNDDQIVQAAGSSVPNIVESRRTRGILKKTELKLTKAFEQEGGFTERLNQKRTYTGKYQ